MPAPVNPPTRRYHAPRRAAAAAQTREEILKAAKARFESRGWAGTTIPAIAADAGVSPKTIEVLFGVKAVLLADVVDYAIRGDATDLPMIRRESTLAVEAAPDAPAMLDLHAAHVATIDDRSARIALVVETAAQSDPHVAQLWARMTKNRRFGAHWAAEILLRKPGVRPDLTLNEAEETFLIAIDWGTYRLLATERAMTLLEVQAWILHYYERMLLPPPPLLASVADNPG